MATITLKYDARNSFAKSFLDAMMKSGVFKVVNTVPNQKSELVKEAQKIAKSVCAIRDGKNETRPLSSLMEEL